MISKKKTNFQAFTLIELLVVVAIIGILAAVGVNTFSGFQEKAKINATLKNHSQAVNQVQSFLASCDIDGNASYVHRNGTKIIIPCSVSLSMHSPIVGFFVSKNKQWGTQGYLNPYQRDLVGVWSSGLIPGNSSSLEKKFRPMGRNGNQSTGYMCCTTLGVVAIERISFAGTQNWKSCDGTCCFIITTAYDVDINDNAKVKINTVSGSSCTK